MPSKIKFSISKFTCRYQLVTNCSTGRIHQQRLYCFTKGILIKHVVFVILLVWATSLQAQMEKNCSLLGSLAIEGGTEILVQDNYAYIAHEDGILIISVSDYSTPIQAGWVATRGQCTCLESDANFVYAGDDSAGVRVYRLQDPLHPELVTIIDMHSLDIYSIAASGNLLAVSSNGRSGLDSCYVTFIDISDIHNPGILGQISHRLFGTAFKKITAADTLIVASEMYGFGIYNVVNPRQPVAVSHLEVGYIVIDLLLEGRYLYGAWTGAGFNIVDVADPSHPELLGHFGFDDKTMAVALEDHFAYVALRNMGLRILDVTDKRKPVQVGQNLYVRYSEGDWTERKSIFVKDRIVFTVDRVYGLYILKNEYRPQAVIEENQDIPTSFSLLQNYPNPFNAQTRIAFQLPKNGQISLQIWNASGQKIRVIKGTFAAGEHSIVWDGRDDAGIVVSSGIYFFKLAVDEFMSIKKAVFIK